MRLLLVEDNPGDAELVRLRLQALPPPKPAMTWVDSLAAGIESQRTSPADVVLLDMHLPDSEGLETIREFRAAHADAPVVVLTGMDDQETAIEALRNGAEDYVVKSDLAPDLLQRACRYAIERRRGLRELHAAVQARDELIRVVSHDLRNHMGTIEVATRLVRMAKTPEEMLGRVEPVERASRTVRRLLDDLVDIAAIEKGVLVVSAADVAANQLVKDAHGLFAAVASDKGVHLQLGVAEGEPKVRADAVRIAQVLGNLIGNALKFTPRGGTITVAAGGGPQAVVLSVSDTGPGIPAADRARIFDRFYRGSRPSGSGAGLGLAIARGLVEAHGGRIWVESADGGGTTFSFSLPRA